MIKILIGEWKSCNMDSNIVLNPECMLTVDYIFDSPDWITTTMCNFQLWGYSYRTIYLSFPDCKEYQYSHLYFCWAINIKIYEMQLFYIQLSLSSDKKFPKNLMNNWCWSRVGEKGTASECCQRQFTFSTPCVLWQMYILYST